MEIEIAQAGHMTQSGSSLLRLIQNNDMPVLDLFVRESVQNSLDAAVPGTRSVTVQFLTGRFDSVLFRQKLSGVSDQIGRRFPAQEYEYLAVRDTDTVGLTGPMNYSAVSENQYGNLLKLIYEICKPQDREGAGGSWGIGKTVYFRIGIGLVLYYSRIRTNSGYESRMAATLVENENSPDALIPRCSSGPSRGIAWWGRRISSSGNETEPITDRNEIEGILREFGIEPYRNEETGTTIIIPYISTEELLRNNATEYHDQNDIPVIPFWRRNLDDYLRIALQRWYAPRLNNPSYSYGCFLRARINGRGVTLDDMEPAFRLVQRLYNYAGSGIQGDTERQGETSEPDKVEIRLRNIFGKQSSAGVLAYARVSCDELGMKYPDNKPSPFMYVNDEIRHRDYNLPIISFCRKPGMIVSYESTGKWADGIPSSDSEHFIFAVFVLNSLNTFKDNPGFTLEEYVRKSEMADHTSWSDWSYGTSNLRPISKIQLQIGKRMTEVFGNEVPESEARQDSGLGRMLGELLLPPESFGKAGSVPRGQDPSGGRTVSRVKSVSLGMGPDAIHYFPNGIMTVKLELRSSKPFEVADVCVGIDSETGTIRAGDWIRKLGMQLPFSVASAAVVFSVPKGEKYTAEPVSVNAQGRKAVSGPFSVEMLPLENGTDAAVRITGDGVHKIKCSLTLYLLIRNREFRTVCYLDEMEDEA